MSSYLKELTYSFSLILSLLSRATLAIILAFARITWKGLSSSSFISGASDFSSKTKQLNVAAQSSGDNSLKKRSKRSSVSNSSSPLLISQATRALICTTSTSLMKSKRRSTRLRHFSSSSCCMDVASAIFLFRALIFAKLVTLSAYCS